MRRHCRPRGTRVPFPGAARAGFHLQARAQVARSPQPLDHIHASTLRFRRRALRCNIFAELTTDLHCHTAVLWRSISGDPAFSAHTARGSGGHRDPESVARRPRSPDDQCALLLGGGLPGPRGAASQAFVYGVSRRGGMLAKVLVPMISATAAMNAVMRPEIAAQNGEAAPNWSRRPVI